MMSPRFDKISKILINNQKHFGVVAVADVDVDVEESIDNRLVTAINNTFTTAFWQFCQVDNFLVKA